MPKSDVTFISDKLWEEYRATKFWIDDQGHKFCIIVDQRSPELDRMLEFHQVEDWAYITAHNPKSQRLKPVDNCQRNQRLLDWIEGEGYPVYKGKGVGSDPEWTPEESYLILGITRKDAISLGCDFGQNAIVFGHIRRTAELVSCHVDLPVYAHL